MRWVNNISRKIILFLAIASASLPVLAQADAKDDPLLGMLMIDQLETRLANNDKPLVWTGQGWIGKDLNKLWIKTDGERVNGTTEEVEFQALYSKALATYWDFQLGMRRDERPRPSRNWVAAGFQGLAPYFFEVDAALFIGESSRTAFRLEAEYELLFTQKLILTPEIEMNFYGKNDPEIGVGSGLSDLELGLRLRYEIWRELAPYIGVNYLKKYGHTANFAADEGEDSTDTQLVLGIRAWF